MAAACQPGIVSAGDAESPLVVPALAAPASKTPPPPNALAPLIELDGTISISPDGSELSYEWKQLSGPKVDLSDPAAAKPSFRTNKPGVYEFQLVVSANGLSSEPHIVRLEIEHENLPPVARVAPQAFGQVGTVLEIDGRQSFDPEGQSLAYRWRPATPGLDIPLSALSMPVLSFEPKADGVFEVELIVSDGEKNSAPASCRITIKPKPKPPVAQARIITTGAQPVEADAKTPKKPSRPVAQVKAVPPPGKDRSGQVTVTPDPPAVTTAKITTPAQVPIKPPAQEASLTASGLTPYASANGNGAPPAESEPRRAAPLTQPASIPSAPPAVAAAPIPPPLPPLPDESDWTPSASLAAQETAAVSPPAPPVPPIRVPPLPPPDSVTAQAYAAMPTIESDLVPEPLAAIPEYSSSALMEPAPMMPPAQPEPEIPRYDVISAPEKPRYDVMSAPTTTLAFDRPRPVARINGPRIVEFGKPVVLDARASGGDGNNGNLEYSWLLKSGQEIRDIEVLYGGAGRRFTAAVPGTYEFELVVADGGVQSAPIVHSVRFTDQPEPPIAVVVAPTRARLGALVTMDATQSYDIVGAKLLFRWRQTGGPSVRNYVIDERLGESSPAFYPPAPGTYSFELIVSNGKLNSRPVEIDIEVEPRLRKTPSVSIDGPETAAVGEDIILTAAISDGEGHILAFHWKQTEGPAPALTPSAGIRAMATPPEPGRYVFAVTALEDGETVASNELIMEVGETNDNPEKRLSPLPRVAGGAPYIAPPSPVNEPPRRGSARVPTLTPLPNTPTLPPPITSFPDPRLPDNGRSRPAAKVLQTGKPPLADLE